MSETVSTRLPAQLIRLLEEEARAKGVSLSTLLRETVGQRYGVEAEAGKAEKPFLAELKEALKVLGESKMKACTMREDCPFKAYGVEPSPVACGICPVHDHAFGVLATSNYNPLRE